MVAVTGQGGAWLLGLWLAIGAAWPVAAASLWQIDQASTLGFLAKQQGAPVEGKFERFSARIDFDPSQLATSVIEVTIDTGSVSTGHKDRDQTLRSAAFFDTAQFPEARFVSRSITAAGQDRYKAKGELTIRDVTKDVVLPFTLTVATGAGPAEQAEAAGELLIKRLDYGVGQGEWASTGTIADEVAIKLAIVASRQP